MTHSSAPSWTGRWIVLVVLALLLAILVGSIGPTSVAAFETLARPWRTNRARYRVNPNFEDPTESGTPAQQIEIIRSAADAWRFQSAADFEFIYDGTTTRKVVALRDGVNSVYFSEEDDPDALAVTIIRFDLRDRVNAFDMLFYRSTNGEVNHWNGPEDPDSDELDLSGVAVHEFGHALGLDHTSIQSATMFTSVVNTGVHLRTLHEDDVAGVEFLYGGDRPGADPLPRIDLIDPTIGPQMGGNEVVIRGRNFTWTDNTTLRIDGAVVAKSLWEVENLALIRIFSMPEADLSGNVAVSIDNTNGFFELADGYRYGDAVPTLSRIEPSLGPTVGGISVEVSGERFSSDAVVTIGGELLVDQGVVDAQTITGTLPGVNGPGLVDVVLTQGNDHVEFTDAFEYTSKRLRIEDINIAVGAIAQPVGVFLSTDEPLVGVSFGFTFDSSHVSVEDIIVDGTFADGAEFAEGQIDNALGEATFGIVMNFLDSELSIPVGDDLSVARLLVNVAEDASAGEVISLKLENEIGSPPIELFFTPLDEATRVRPHVQAGSLTVTLGPLFIRGDANGSEHVDLADAVYHLDWLFRGGSPSPCPDASDTNDDGQQDISDGVFLLLFLFRTEKPMPLPYPEPGLDLTEDELDC